MPALQVAESGVATVAVRGNGCLGVIAWAAAAAAAMSPGEARARSLALFKGDTLRFVGEGGGCTPKRLHKLPPHMPVLPMPR